MSAHRTIVQAPPRAPPRSHSLAPPLPPGVQDLLALSRTAKCRSKTEPAQAKRASHSARIEFFFEDYLESVRTSMETGCLGIVEKICQKLRLPPTPLPPPSAYAVEIHNGKPRRSSLAATSGAR